MSWQAQASPSAWERDKREKVSRLITKGRSARNRLVAEALIVTAVLAVGAALAWWLLTPDVFAEATDNGFRISTEQARREFGIDAWFAAFTAAAGAIGGAWLMYRHRHDPVAVQITLVCTGALAAVATWQLGYVLGPGDLAERAAAVDAGTMLALPLDLSSYAALSVWPIAAVIAGAAVVGLRHDDASDEPPPAPGGPS